MKFFHAQKEAAKYYQKAFEETEPNSNERKAIQLEINKLQGKG